MTDRRRRGERLEHLLGRHRHAVAGAALGALLAACAPVASPDAEVELGDFAAPGKADAVEVEVPFEVGPGERVRFHLRTLGRLHVDTLQDAGPDGARVRLQLEAESPTYRRRSWRGRAPFLRIPGTRTGGELTEYTLTLVSWGDAAATGVLRITTDEPGAAGIRLFANQPDCADCDDRAGDLRRAVLDAIQGATRSIDLAVYGLDDPAVIEALCNAAEAGVRVRVVSDSEEADELGERYHDALMSPAAGLVGCGIPVELIDTSGIMHDKFFVIDAGTDAALLLTGSTNQTTAGFEVNHNHAVVVRGSSALVDAYAAEFEQLFTHCVANGCNECTPACTADVSGEGPYRAGEASVRLFFSPSDDALEALRGQRRVERRDEPDPACGRDADCLCTRSGSAWRCDYCAQGPDGWGLLGEADERVLASLYSVTDACFALGVARAADRGVEAVLVYDKVKAASPYSMDEQTCAMGVRTLVSEWGDGSAQARNHHKLIVVDDAVMTGSMNLSDSAIERNHENTLLVDDPRLAAQAAALVRSEVGRLESLGVTSSCR